MTVAVGLQTCNRLDLTYRTVTTFYGQNDPSRFLLLHADDASDDPAVFVLAKEYGFRTVVHNLEREGMTATRHRLIAAAARRGADWFLLLENDIETVRPFPWPLFDYASKNPNVVCLRLYGRYKDVDGLEPCLTTHKRRGHQPVKWRAFRGAPEKSQIGEIHWSAQPAVTRIGPLLNLHRYGAEPDGWTVRVKKNVVSHIGEGRRTEGRVM